MVSSDSTSKGLDEFCNAIRRSPPLTFNSVGSLVKERGMELAARMIAESELNLPPASEEASSAARFAAACLLRKPDHDLVVFASMEQK